MLRILPLLFFVTSASAQVISSESKVLGTPLIPQQFTASDTVQALQRLFNNRRTSGALLLGGTGALVVASNIALNNESGIPSSDAGSNFIIASGITLLYTSPFWVIGTSKLARFSKKKEQIIIDEFTTKHTLPSKIRRRLKSKLFMAR